MEAVVVDRYSGYYNKQISTLKKNTRVAGFKPSKNIAPANMYGSGIFHSPLLPPPSLSFSYTPSSSASLLHNPYQRQQNPPLLPLPVPLSSPAINRGLSCPPTTRKTNRPARDHSATPRKPKSKPVGKLKSESMVIASTNRLGPDPNDLPKALITSKSVCSALVEDLDKFSGSVFSLAPPPSSLPLPRFSMRPKLSCNAEAAGIDAGATDNLRRLLRLR
ncbi:hypothetical protein PanWU01x14_059070 [Parasponia andersonii]|uniref:Uncharacterized protein n=1 Tax=Parasponia andersonii TaxID=3476 RepID=A0A2P5DJE0_PARAD|nr:hypothetical protein PanWU01x14_059070 [Parasponia andersonii]